MKRFEWAWCVLAAAALAGGCKTEEQKQREQAEERLKAAAQEMGKAAAQLGAQGAAQGVQGAAQGMQGAAQGMQGAAQAMQGAAEAMRKMAMGGNGTNYQPVDFREMKALLPDTLAGMQRKSATGERAGMGGFNIAQAEGKYESAAGHLRVKLLDIGSSVGPMAMGLMAWGMVDIDRETEHGYEKTTKLDGRKAYEKYDNSSKSGELNVLVGTRFLVEIRGESVSMDDMKGALNKIDLSKLEGLKPVAAGN